MYIRIGVACLCALLLSLTASLFVFHAGTAALVVMAIITVVFTAVITMERRMPMELQGLAVLVCAVTCMYLQTKGYQFAAVGGVPLLPAVLWTAGIASGSTFVCRIFLERST